VELTFERESLFPLFVIASVDPDPPILPGFRVSMLVLVSFILFPARSF
jgi:hypothetical protein